jgi:hypothetical protein
LTPFNSFLKKLTFEGELKMSKDTLEKDNFWLYVGGLVFAVVILVVFIKSNEHGKYETTAKAIAEDSNVVTHVSKNN